MIGRAEAYGAISVVNAIASGLGCSLSVSLKTRAEVKVLGEDDSIKVRLESVEHKPRDIESAKIIVEEIVRSISGRRLGAEVTTFSEIPLAKGLKSSSAACNAIALAVDSALVSGIGEMELIKIGVRAAIKANVTVTGAFDDACASYLGGYCLTDNTHMKLLKREECREDLRVLIYVPEGRLDKQSINRNEVEAFRGQIP